MKKAADGLKWAHVNKDHHGSSATLFGLFSALWLKLIIIFFCPLKLRPFIFGTFFFGLLIFGPLLYNQIKVPVVPFTDPFTKNRRLDGWFFGRLGKFVQKSAGGPERAIRFKVTPAPVFRSYFWFNKISALWVSWPFV